MTDKYPKELDKESIKWLRTRGYSLNSDDKRYVALRKLLKENYKWHYYMWVDLDIKKEAESLVPLQKYWGTKFAAMKRKLLKEKYGIKK